MAATGYCFAAFVSLASETTWNHQVVCRFSRLPLPLECLNHGYFINHPVVLGSWSCLSEDFRTRLGCYDLFSKPRTFHSVSRHFASPFFCLGIPDSPLLVQRQVASLEPSRVPVPKPDLGQYFLEQYQRLRFLDDLRSIDLLDVCQRLCSLPGIPESTCLLCSCFFPYRWFVNYISTWLTVIGAVIHVNLW